jgi:hypothetical protein
MIFQQMAPESSLKSLKKYKNKIRPIYIFNNVGPYGNLINTCEKVSGDIIAHYDGMISGYRESLRLKSLSLMVIQAYLPYLQMH